MQQASNATAKAILLSKRAIALGLALIPGIFVGVSAYLVWAFFHPAHGEVHYVPLGDIIHWAANMMRGAYQDARTLALVGLPIVFVYDRVVRPDFPFVRIGIVGVMVYVLAITLANQPVKLWLAAGSLAFTLMFQIITLSSVVISTPIARKLGALNSPTASS